MKRQIGAALSFSIFALGLAACAAQGNQPVSLEKIMLPPGFSISIYASGVRNAREMALGPGGTLFVASMNAGNVYAVVVNDKLPNEEHHGWKFIAFGPDGMLYVPVGAPCNICKPDARHGVINRMNPDGSGLEVFAMGIRNSVGFDWHPENKELWFTDNGRDGMGDNVPPDELNYAPNKGMNFGYPYCHAGTIQDPEIRGEPCSKFTPPAIPLTPHGASIGMRFYTGTMFPAQYKNQIFVAEHGSWNRSTPIGYRIMLVRLEGTKAVKYEPFAEGWLQGSRAWGRPADVLVMPDGALLVSDDQAGVIYRIAYK